jgi:DNA-directed RNA polymerase I and III subunit RPAC1
MADVEPSYSVFEEVCAQIPGASEITDPVPDSTVEIISYEKIADTGEDRLIFDLINAPASHANALRRTLISSVPSVAIEIVGILNNTGVMPDQIFCHRLGLIPINARPDLLRFPPEPITDLSSDPESVLLFGLFVRVGTGPTPDCSGVDASMEEHLAPTYVGSDGIVLSSHLVWMPFPGQRDHFESRVSTLHLDIPITKILLGQEIHCYCRAIKGIGTTHAKFSPVCTAFYRLVPYIEVEEHITETKKASIVKICPKKVFDIEAPNFVARPRDCTTCRECIRNERTKEFVKVGKIANRFEFTVSRRPFTPIRLLPSFHAQPSPAVL